MQKNTPNWSINESTITCVVDGELYTIQRDHPEARLILRAIKERLPGDQVVQLFNKITAIARYMCGAVEVRGNTVFCGGEPVRDVIAERILQFMGEGLPYEPLVAFLNRINANPSKWSRDQLYSFLEHKNLPITPSGTFLAYKAIRNDWKDKYSGKFLNKVGCTLSMQRNKVDDDPEQHCSYGFHVGSIEYVNSFAYGYGSAGGDRIVIVEVDPADAVSVPSDCSCQKMRTCRYKVVAEYTGLLPQSLVNDPSQPYQGHDPAQYEEDEFEDEDDVDWDDNDADDDEDGDDVRSEFDEGFDEGYRAALATLQAHKPV